MHLNSGRVTYFMDSVVESCPKTRVVMLTCMFLVLIMLGLVLGLVYWYAVLVQ